MSDDMTCEQVQDAAPELVLGALDGAERAAMLRHLLHCPRCRTDVAELADLVDNLGLLAAPVVPSSGFEDRVLAAMGLADSSNPAAASPSATPMIPPGPPPGAARDGRAGRRWPRVVLAVAAVVLVAMISAGVVRAIDNPNHQPEVVQAAMIGGGDTKVGTAVVVGTDRPLVVVSVGYGITRQDYTLLAIGADGRATKLGAMKWHDDGTYTWGGPVPLDAGVLAELQIVAPDGSITCRATL